MWKPIAELPVDPRGKNVVALIAINTLEARGSSPYTSDPYCGWRIAEINYPESFARWPHRFLPTHFCELPSTK